MSDRLLELYNDELRVLRQRGGAFAAAHPDVANHLRIDQDGVSADPHVERLMEGFAYLTARIRRKISDEFPEVTDALLGVIYPHLLNPVPSASIAQFTLAADQTAPHRLRRGSAIETDPIDGMPCKFRTTVDTTLWPIRIESANIGPIEEKLPGHLIPPDAVSRLRIRLRSTSKDVTFGALAALKENPLKSLRFFLHGGGHRPLANMLYEFLMSSVCEGGLLVCTPKPPTARGQADPASFDSVAVLPDNGIVPGGFLRDEAMLPHDARTFPGYRLLMEYFAFPWKFLFADIGGLSTENIGMAAGAIDLLMFFDRTSTELEKGVSASTLRLGCAPIVNLFDKMAEEIDLTHRELSYRVVADARNERGTEVYSINRVDVNGKRYAPLYGLTHGSGVGVEQGGLYWHASRRKSLDHDDNGTEVDLSFVDLRMQRASVGRPAEPLEGGTARVSITCLNRDWPAKLKLGAGETRLHLDKAGPVTKVEAIVPQTQTLRPSHREENQWKIISHLSLNHLTLTGGGDGATALREILKLYDFADTESSRARIGAVRSIRSSRSTYRVPPSAGTGGAGGFCSGVEIELTLDEKRFSDNGVFLFATVLERFLALGCTINSATRLVVKTGDRTWKPWPARAGERALL